MTNSTVFVIGLSNLIAAEGQRCVLYETRHDKTNKMSVHPAKTQIRLGIRPDDQSLRCALIG